MAVDPKTLNTLNAIWKQTATDDPIQFNNAASALHRMMRERNIHPDEVPLRQPGIGLSSNAGLSAQLRTEQRLRVLAETQNGQAEQKAARFEAQMKEHREKRREAESELRKVRFENETLKAAAGLRSKPNQDQSLEFLKQKLEATEVEAAGFRKALEYVAEYVSESVFTRCLYQGQQYADEDGIVGEVTWPRRGKNRPARTF